MYKYLIAMTLWATQAVAQQGSLTLAACISTTHANNLEVKQGEWQVEAGLVNWQQAKANRLPQLNGSIGYGTRYGRSIDVATNAFVNEQVSNNTLGLNANVTIFSGMQLNNAVKQGATNVQASQMDVQQLKDQLTLRVVLAYLQVLSNDEQVNVAQSQVQATQKRGPRRWRACSNSRLSGPTTNWP
jgi:outer membrane protein